MAEEKSTFNKFKTGVGTFGKTVLAGVGKVGNAMYEAGMAAQGVPIEKGPKGIDTLKLMEFKMQRDILSQLGFNLPDMTPGDLGITIPNGVTPNGVTAESALNQFRGGQAQQMPGQPTGQGGMVVSGINAALPGGGSVSLKPDPAAEEARKQEALNRVKAGQQIPSVKTYIESYRRAKDELSSAGLSTGEGIGPLLARQTSGRFKEMAQQLPMTTAFQGSRDELSMSIAKTVSGGQLSDQERKAVSKNLADVFNYSDKTNLTKLLTRRDELAAKYGATHELDEIIYDIAKDVEGSDKILSKYNIGKKGSTGNYTMDDLFAGVE